MDVQKVGKLGLPQVSINKQGPTEQTTFQEVIIKGREEKLQSLMGKIEQQGKVLEESRTVDELRKYKKLVKEFMDDAVKHGLSLEEHRGFNRRGRTKVYKIVREVDKKLIDLTNNVLDKQKQGLDILQAIGEIKGLLINIYT